jgi:hypothetical protein
MVEDVVEDENVYGEGGREEMVDNDEISAEEEGFMKGYDSAEAKEEETVSEEEFAEEFDEEMI